MPGIGAYIICGTPRSGSTLLCDLLTATGAAGRPASYFRAESIPRWHQRLNVPRAADAAEADFDRAYLAAVLAEGRGGSAVFGLRLMWESLGDLLRRLGSLHPGRPDDRARLEAAFGPLLFIHLTRADRVAQAVSRVRAMQTGLWHMAADGSERERVGPGQAAVYDGEAIGRFVAELTAQEAAWEVWFAANGVEPVRVTYEGLAEAPRGEVERVLAGLGLDVRMAAGVEARTRKMGDGVSEEWVGRWKWSESRSVKHAK